AQALDGDLDDVKVRGSLQVRQDEVFIHLRLLRRQHQAEQPEHAHEQAEEQSGAAEVHIAKPFLEFTVSRPGERRGVSPTWPRKHVGLTPRRSPSYRRRTIQMPAPRPTVVRVMSQSGK